MKMHKLKSKAATAYGYDEDEKALVVHYSGGGSYRYADVPPEIAHGLASAKSVGAYLATRIKGKFEHVKQ